LSSFLGVLFIKPFIRPFCDDCSCNLKPSVKFLGSRFSLLWFPPEIVTYVFYSQVFSLILRIVKPKDAYELCGNISSFRWLEYLAIWQPLLSVYKTIKWPSYLKSNRQTQRRATINSRAIRAKEGDWLAWSLLLRKNWNIVHCLPGNMVTAVILNSYKGFYFFPRRCSVEERQ